MFCAPSSMFYNRIFHDSPRHGTNCFNKPNQTNRNSTIRFTEWDPLKPKLVRVC